MIFEKGARFDEPGTGANEKPHLLIATLDIHCWGGVDWRVQCPYEGIRPCGAVEECRGTPEDAKKWGCEPLPKAPEGFVDMTVPGPQSDRRRAEWDEFSKKLVHWRDEVHGGYEWHRTKVCWFQNRIPSGDFEPEDFLSCLPADMEIKSPIKVMVGYEGHGEDVEPVFKLWEEPTDADS